jgi:hypothetical protein
MHPISLTDLPTLRLHHQQLAATTLTTPEAVVEHLVAVQAQEYAQAKWALGLRLPDGATDAAVEAAFQAGALLRTHILRPTWHFVAPADLRWLLALSAPRVHAANASMYRRCAIDADTLRRSHDVLARALEGGQYLTRTALEEKLAQAGIAATDGVRLAYLVMAAELDGVVVSGPRQGKQFTYALFEERVPPAAPRPREEALAELTQRYFATRGPATIRDFVWWSGLTMAEARAGMAQLPDGFVRQTIDGEEYCWQPREIRATPALQTTFLMPNYDEYGISYKDRRAIFAPQGSAVNPVFNHMVVVEGRLAGGWKETVKGRSVHVETAFFAPLNDGQQRQVHAAVERYRAFRESA